MNAKLNQFRAAFAESVRVGQDPQATVAAKRAAFERAQVLKVEAEQAGATYKQIAAVFREVLDQA